MLCPRCKSKNVDGVLFCSECGAPLRLYIDPLSPLFSAEMRLGIEEKHDHHQKLDGRQP